LHSKCVLCEFSYITWNAHMYIPNAY
jgi:hypothetical protein